jgi:hypothetical protein
MVNQPPAPSAPPPWPPAGVPRRPRRWTAVAWLVALALVAGVAIVGWLRPTQDHKSSGSPAPAYTDQQVATAKANICAAFDKVQHATDLAHSHVGSPDYSTQLAASALTNVALDSGSRYLLTKLAEEPATPVDLATAVRNEANAEQEALIGYLNGLSASDPQMQPAVNASEEATATIRRLCK